MIETYVPLYRKYRPQQFSDLVGQDVVSTALCNALTLHKINHAYLFCGPRGTGKTSSARIFAKSLNCVNGPTPTPCQECPSCVSVTQGSALDVTEIDAASNNSVDDIRELTDKVQFSPIQGKFKIYIIDEVHMLSTAAFNALLKTLEEPPPNVIFIFATTEPHKVLPTIISRCQRFDFSRITRAQIEARLAYVAQQENIQIAPEALTLIGRHVRGGMRDALGMLDQVSVLGRSENGRMITPADVRAFIGVMEEDLLFDLTQGFVEKDPAKVLQQVTLLQERGVEPTRVVRELTQHFRNLLIAKSCGPNASVDQLDISPDLYPKLCEQVKGFEIEEIPQMLSRLSLLESQLRHSPQPMLWLEVGMLDICYRQEIHVVRELAERVAALENALQGKQPLPQARPAATAQPTQNVMMQTMPMASQPIPPQPQATPPQQPTPQPVAQQPVTPPMQAPVAPVPLEPPAQPVMAEPPMPAPSQPAQVNNPMSADLGNLWRQTLAAIKSMPTRTLIEQHLTLAKVTENAVIIGYAKETIFDSFIRRSPDKVNHIEQAVNTVFGPGYRVKFELVEQVVPPTPVAPIRQEPVSAPVRQEEPVNVPIPTQSSPIVEQQLAQAPPRFDNPPSVERPPVAQAGVPEEEIDFDLLQAKKYTQELLQGKLLD